MAEVHLLDPLPFRGLTQCLRRAGQLPGQLHPFRCRPCGSVYPIGNRPDRNLRWVEPGPQLIEHAPAHPAVQFRDPVGALGKAQTHMRHVELVGITFGAKGKDPLHRHTGQQTLIGLIAEVALHHLDRKPVDPGRYRSMGGEHRTGPHHGQRGVEIEVIGGHELPDALQSKKTRVALIHVEDVRCGTAFDGCECSDGAYPADTGQQFLFDPVFLVAAVQPVGDVTQIVVVLRDVGIEQQQRDPTHLSHPDPRPQHTRFRHGQFNDHRSAVRVRQ